MCLLQAAKTGETDVIRVFLSHGDKADLAGTDDEGANPMIWAAYQGHVDIVRLLINQTGYNINAQSKSGENELYSQLA